MWLLEYRPKFNPTMRKWCDGHFAWWFPSMFFSGIITLFKFKFMITFFFKHLLQAKWRYSIRLASSGFFGVPSCPQRQLELYSIHAEATLFFTGLCFNIINFNGIFFIEKTSKQMDYSLAIDTFNLLPMTRPNRTPQIFHISSWVRSYFLIVFKSMKIWTKLLPRSPKVPTKLVW